MRHFFKVASVAIITLFTSCNSSAQQKDDYSVKIDSLIKTTNPRSFNGVVYIQQNGKEKYAKAFGYADVYEIGHTGFHPSEGFTAVDLYYPKTKTSVILMENQANENFDIAYYFEEQIRKIAKESQLLK